MSGDQIGSIIGVAFGCAWGIAGGVSLPSPWRVATIIGSLLISACLVILIGRFEGTATGHFDGATNGTAVAGEVVAIVIAAIALNRTRHSSLIPPAVAAIVGLHFLGLWRATGNFSFVWLAGALCAVGFLAGILPRSARLSVTGIGSAVALWAAAPSTVVRP
ncbi:MAG: hypothetical protein KGJ55_11145 [Gammaproteobacteria bacterium]|nr:hypothetical protein [Gammaproteobacteria bacterium]